MDTPSAPRQFGTPAELRAAVTCPVTRFAYATLIAGSQRWLPPDWAAQRRADLIEALKITTRRAIREAVTAKGGVLTRQRLHGLTVRARREQP